MAGAGRRLVAAAAAALTWVRHANAATSTSTAAAPEDAVIRPGVAWYDTDGNRIYAGGANIYFENGVYYLIGEGQKLFSDCSECLNLYSSPDLTNWQFRGCALNNSNVVAPPPFNNEPYYRMERPKLFKCPGTGKYMVWFHCDLENFAMSSVGVLSSDSVTGPFTFVSPCFKPDGQDSYDMGTFVDMGTSGDRRAYLIRSVRNSFAGISQMTDDCTGVTGIVSQGPNMEGQALMRDTQGVLHAAGSHLTGWNPNPAQFVTSTSPTLVGASWDNNINPSGSGTTYDTQSTFIFPFTHPDGHVTYVWMADRWNANGPGGLDNMTMVWLPLLPPTNTTPGTPPSQGWQLAIAVCDPTDTRQLFTLQPDNTVVHASGLCVQQQAVVAAGQASSLLLAACNASDGSQKWYTQGANVTLTTLSSTPVGGGQGCVHWNVANQQLVQSNPVLAWACGSSAGWNEEWFVPAVGEQASIEASSSGGTPSGYCATVQPPPAPKPGWFLALDTCNPASPLQQFRLTNNTVVHTPSGLCVQQQDAGGPGTSLILAPCGAAMDGSQTWFAAVNTVASTASGSGAGCVNWNIDNGDVNAGTAIIPYDCGSSPAWNSQWQILPTGAPGILQALEQGGSPSSYCASVVAPSNPTQWSLPWYSAWSLKDF